MGGGDDAGSGDVPHAQKVGPDMLEEPSGAMSVVPTLVLLVGVVVLGLWIVYGQQEVQDLSTRFVLKEELPAAEVAGLTITRPQQPALQLVRQAVGERPEEVSPDTFAALRAATWALTEPVQDVADAARVANLILALEQAQALLILRGEEAQQVQAEFETTCTVGLELASGESLTIELGPLRGAGEQYLRRAGDPKVYLVRGDVGKAFELEPWDLRQRALFRDASQSTGWCRALTLERSSRALGGEREDRELAFTLDDEGFWRIGASAASDGVFANVEDVTELTTMLGSLTAARAESEDPDANLLNRAGLSPEPWIRVRMQGPSAAGAPAEVTLELGDPLPDLEGFRYARVSDRAVLYAVELGPVADLLDDPLQAYLGRKLLPVRSRAEGISGLRVEFPAADGQQGKRLVLERGEDGWFFPEGIVADARPEETEALIRDLLALEISSRKGPPEGLGELEPLNLTPETAVRLELVEGELVRRLRIGARTRQGGLGVHWVLREGDQQVFICDLGATLERLREAELDLLDSRIFQASRFDVKRVRLLAADGSPELVVERVDEPGTEQDDERWTQTVPEPSDPVSSEKIGRFVQDLDQIYVRRWRALTSEESRVRYGLDQPRRLQVELEVFDSQGQLVSQTRELLLGRRRGDRVAGLALDGRAIGDLDTGFLDRIRAGFAVGSRLVGLPSRWVVTGLAIAEEGVAIREYAKAPGRTPFWTERESREQLDEDAVKALEVLLDDLVELEVTNVTQGDAAERGLAPRPRWTVVLKDEDDQLHGIEIGGIVSEDKPYLRWARGGKQGEVDASRAGVLYDGPLRALERFLADHPLPAPFPPADELRLGPPYPVLDGEDE